MNSYPTPLSPAVTSSMKGNRRIDTKPERRLRSILHRMGYRFRKDFPIAISPKRKCRPDIAFTRIKLAVFVDGCFWHCCPEHGHFPNNNREYWIDKLTGNQNRDINDTKGLELEGWAVLRIWEHVPLELAVSGVTEQYNSISSQVCIA